MPNSKPITISVQLKPGRDDRIITKLCKGSVNLSAVIREALTLYLDKMEGKDNMKDEISEILHLVKSGAISPKPKSRSVDNPFLNSSP